VQREQPARLFLQMVVNFPQRRFLAQRAVPHTVVSTISPPTRSPRRIRPGSRKRHLVGNVDKRSVEAAPRASLGCGPRGLHQCLNRSCRGGPHKVVIEVLRRVAGVDVAPSLAVVCSLHRVMKNLRKVH
jgi:hypothetical protein